MELTCALTCRENTKRAGHVVWMSLILIQTCHIISGPAQRGNEASRLITQNIHSTFSALKAHLNCR